MSTRQLFIMVKEPRPGRVKTRLGAGIGMTNAAWWFRHQTSKLIRSVARDPRWQTTLAVSPDIEGKQSRVWPVDIRRCPQGKGNLGTRMGAIFQNAAAGPVLIIGADIPNITPALIEKAFRVLGRHDAVFGPAPDGGYWLIGLKRGTSAVPVGLFQNVRWSSKHALADTLATLGSASFEMIDELSDVDTAQDLRKPIANNCS